MRFFLSQTPGAWALLPTLVLTTGHCECHPGQVSALSLLVTWLGVEAGIEFEIQPHG